MNIVIWHEDKTITEWNNIIEAFYDEKVHELTIYESEKTHKIILDGNFQFRIAK